MNIYEKLGKDNLKRYGTDSSRIMQIIIREYSDRTHFIYEILQNAEDADATFIRFRLNKDSLEVIHNGRPFNEKDIEGVCGIAAGSKGDGTRIGHFGIGFKSVYAYTNTPWICSGGYSFDIHEYIFPSEHLYSEAVVDDAALTFMRLPFDKKEVSRTTAFNEINKAFTDKIAAETIMMLKNLKSIQIAIEGRSSIISITKTEKNINRSSKTKRIILTTDTESANRQIKKEEQYLFFTENKKKACAIVFRVDNNSLAKIDESKIYAYFPTAKEAHQNFYIHAPFDTTPARDNFQEGADYGRNNIKLVDNLCDLMETAFCWLQENKYLNDDTFGMVYPAFAYPKNDMLRPLYERAVAMIKEKKILLPTVEKDIYCDVNHAMLPTNYRIKLLISSADYFRLTGQKRFWISDHLGGDGWQLLRQLLKDNFDILTVSWNDLLQRISAEYLEEKSIRWLEDLIDALRPFCRTHSVEFQHIRQIPWVRLKNGHHIRAFLDEAPQVYLNNPASCDNKISERCLNSVKIFAFYRDILGIPDFNLEREIIDNILPKYQSQIPLFRTKNSFRENLTDLKLIHDALEQRIGSVNHVRECYMLTDGVNWKKPSDLCIPSTDKEYGYHMLNEEQRNALLFVSKRYLNRSDCEWLDTVFLSQLGCNKGLPFYPESKERYIYEYDKSVEDPELRNTYARIFSKKFWSRDVKWAYTFYGLRSFFDNMTREKSLQIVDFLNSHKEIIEIQVEMTFADSRELRKNPETYCVYTMIGLELAFHEWIYAKGKKKPRRPLDIDRDDLMTEYYQYPDVLDILPFQKRNSALVYWLQDNFEDPTVRDLIKSMLSKPDDVAKLAQRVANENIRKRKKKNERLEDQLKKQDRDQMVITEDDDFEISGISEAALKRREERLEQQIKESFGDEVSVTSNITFTSRTSSKEEKAFLRQEYSGICQICTTSIKDYKGGCYFEAVNILKVSELAGQFISSIDLGWNSLCLCPNCAAKFKYGSKRISSIYDQVREKKIEAEINESIDLDIEMPVGHDEKIHYSPRHFLALKKVFQLMEE